MKFMTKEDDVKALLQQARNELYMLLEREWNLSNDEEILAISRKLDVLIVEYHLLVNTLDINLSREEG